MAPWAPPPSMVTAEARDGVETKMLEVGLRKGAAAREPAVPNSRCFNGGSVVA